MRPIHTAVSEPKTTKKSQTSQTQIQTEARISETPTHAYIFKNTGNKHDEVLKKK